MRAAILGCVKCLQATTVNDATIRVVDSPSSDDRAMTFIQGTCPACGTKLSVRTPRSKEEILEGIDGAIALIAAHGGTIALRPLELGLGGREHFTTNEALILEDALCALFGMNEAIDPGQATLLVGMNNGVSLYVETAKSGEIVYFLAPESYEQ